MRKNFIFSVDLGGTNLKLALFDSNLKLLTKNIYSTIKYRTKNSLIKAISGVLRNSIGISGLTRDSLLGVGLGLPGPVDYKRGIVHYFPNIPGWKEVPLARLLRKKLKIPVIVDNDANLMCLAEARLGAAAKAKNAVCLTLGTGVGGALIIEGRLYRGSNYLAGEIGHIPINIKGPRCNCGGIACLERYIGNRYIAEYARRLFGKEVSLETLSRLANRGNKRALEVWRITGRYLGLALAGIVNLLNPDTIVIGGGVAEAGDILFKETRRTILERAMPDSARGVKVVKARLGSDAGLKGAALLVKDEFSKT